MTPTERRAARGEEGSGSVLALGVIAAVVVVMTVALAVASALAAAHTARSAADLSALAAAQTYERSGDQGGACASARSIAVRNGGELVSCTVAPDGVATVSTTARVSLRLTGLSPSRMEGAARAGPAPADARGPPRAGGRRGGQPG